MVNSGLYSRTHTEHAEVYAPGVLKDLIREVNQSLQNAVTAALADSDPSAHVADIYAIQVRRNELYDQAYAESPELRSHGRTTEYFSPEILTEFLQIAGKRINARDAIEKGSVERKRGIEDGDSTIRILDDNNNLIILFDGCGRVWENGYDSEGHLVIRRYFTDNTKMDENAYSEGGTYTGSLEWITEFRTVDGASESRAFTGLGTLNYDWKRDGLPGGYGN